MLSDFERLQQKAAFLGETLAVAVSMQIEELHKRPLDEVIEDLLALAPIAAELIASKGDLLIFPSAKKGETAHVFNTLARVVAQSAVVVPGGFPHLFGREFCFPHPELDLELQRSKLPDLRQFRMIRRVRQQTYPL